MDACGLSALGALMAFRRPDLTVGGGDDGQAVTVHSPDVREPLPLSIHHLPLPITFALFEVRRGWLNVWGEEGVAEWWVAGVHWRGWQGAGQAPARSHQSSRAVGWASKA